jgi:hypothetical protein
MRVWVRTTQDEGSSACKAEYSIVRDGAYNESDRIRDKDGGIHDPLLKAQNELPLEAAKIYLSSVFQCINGRKLESVTLPFSKEISAASALYAERDTHGWKITFSQPSPVAPLPEPTKLKETLVDDGRKSIMNAVNEGGGTDDPGKIYEKGMNPLVVTTSFAASGAIASVEVPLPHAPDKKVKNSKPAANTGVAAPSTPSAKPVGVGTLVLTQVSPSKIAGPSASTVVPTALPSKPVPTATHSPAAKLGTTMPLVLTPVGSIVGSEEKPVIDLHGSVAPQPASDTKTPLIKISDENKKSIINIINRETGDPLLRALETFFADKSDIDEKTRGLITERIKKDPKHYRKALQDSLNKKQRREQMKTVGAVAAPSAKKQKPSSDEE